MQDSPSQHKIATLPHGQFLAPLLQPSLHADGLAVIFAAAC